MRVVPERKRRRKKNESVLGEKKCSKENTYYNFLIYLFTLFQVIGLCVFFLS